MNNTEVRQTILRSLYKAHFFAGGTNNLNMLCEKENWNNTTLRNIVDRMSHEGLIEAWTAGGNYQITPHGVIFAEKQGIVPEKLVEENDRLRTIILDTSAKVYEEQGRYADVFFEELVEEINVDKDKLMSNLLLLSKLGYVEIETMGSYRIAYEGLEAVEKWRQLEAIVEEFDRISEMRPQPRGRALQKLFARIVERDGWSQEESVKTSHEEMDLIVFRDREYYLVECKWEKSPIEASVIRELYGKLGNRIGVRGIAVSMSGFTKGAMKQVFDYVNTKIILLFGPEDVNLLVNRQTTFDELLNEKYKKLVTQKKVVFS